MKMENTIKAQVWLIEDGKKYLWTENFKIVDELPYKGMTELKPFDYDVPQGDCNSYRFFMKKVDEDDIVLVAIREGELQTFEDGQRQAREDWNEIYSNHDEDDFESFAYGAIDSGNNDVYHSSAYYDGYKSEVLKIAKETGFSAPWAK